MGRLLDHLVLVMGGGVLVCILASVELLSKCIERPMWPLVAMAVVFFVATGFHSGTKVFGKHRDRWSIPAP